MTYPPQQPGPYGQDPYGQQRPAQPPPYGGQSAYQGLGSYAGGQPPPPPQPPPPKKRNTGMIVAIVLIVLLVLGGGGVALVVLTGDDDPNAAADDSTTSQPTTGAEPSDDAPASDEPTDEDPASTSSNSPEDVREAYMTAYENKDFSEVVDSACAAYKNKYTTDTTSLEETLAPYDITAKADGEPDVNGNTATAKINLELTQAGTTERPKIFIKIVEEDGEWRFCGEGEA